MRPLVLTALAVLLAAGAVSQPVVVTGTVHDARSGEPLGLANVYVASTTIGAATGPDGTFRLEVPAALGEVVVVASTTGYSSRSEGVELEPGGTTDLRFRLRQRTVRGAEVVVEVEEDADWARQLDWFRRLFFGETPNAERVVLENPEVLSFREYRGELTARADAPLETVSGRLGYRIVWERLSFEGDGFSRDWSGNVRFEPFEGTPDEERAWEETREETYRGSWRHFLAALQDGRTAEEGFEVFAVGRRGWIPGFGLPLDADALAGGLLPEAGRRVWLVQYLRESMPGSHVGRPMHNITGSASLGGWPQRSWLEIGSEGLLLGPGGEIANPREHVLSGYWEWERAAELLPSDYVPPD